MPQASGCNKKSDVPYGAGSVVTNLQQARARTLRRAVKVNHGLDKRYEHYESILDRHQRAEANRASKMLFKIERDIQEIEAYKHVAEKLKLDNLKILKFGFSPRDVTTPNSFRKYQLERKVMNSGFGIQSVYPQVLETIADLDPERLKEAERARTLAEAKRLSDFSIDRRITNAAVNKEQQALKLGISQKPYDVIEETGTDYYELPSGSDKMRSQSYPVKVGSGTATTAGVHPQSLRSSSLKLLPLLVTKDDVKARPT